MNQQLINEIYEELSHAGEDVAMIEMRERLAKRLITPDTVIQPMEFLFEMFGKPCFPRGELVGITGKAKSGKTYLSSMLMTLCFRRVVMGVRRRREEQLRVLWIDTEQSEESTQDILRNRIVPMMNGACENDWYEGKLQIDGFPLEMFQIFNLRGEMWQERLPLLEAAVQQQRPDLVILDGVRDLVNDINDGVMAQEVIERLMKMASETRCCIVCILHQNKNVEDKNLRGFLGTELRNKAFEVYECVKSPDRVFSVQQTDTRKYDIIDKLEFTVRQDGIPRVYVSGIGMSCAVETHSRASQQPCTQPCPQPSETTPATTIRLNDEYVKAYDTMNKPIMDIEKLFRDAFNGCETIGHQELMSRTMEISNIDSPIFFQRCLNQAVQQRIICKSYGLDRKVIYAITAASPP